jgi:hypothetical protein
VAVLLVGIVTPAGRKLGSNVGVYVDPGVGRRRKQNWSYTSLEGIRAALQHMGILTYQVPSKAHVPEGLRHMAEMFESPEHFEDKGLPQVGMLAPKMGFLATQLTGIPGIGPNLARPIAAQYETFARFYEEATVESLATIEGIGKLTAERIHAAFHTIEGDPQVVRTTNTAWWEDES